MRGHDHWMWRKRAALAELAVTQLIVVIDAGGHCGRLRGH